MKNEELLIDLENLSAGEKEELTKLGLLTDQKKLKETATFCEMIIKRTDFPGSPSPVNITIGTTIGNQQDTDSTIIEKAANNMKNNLKNPPKK